MGLLLCMLKIRKRIEYSPQRLKMVQSNDILPSVVQYLGEPWTDCMWYQRIGSQVSNPKCSLLPGPIESEDSAEKQGWPRPSREENLVQLQSYWWWKYSFLNSGQISLTAQQWRKGNSMESNLGRAIQCYLLLTLEHVRFPKLGNVTCERSHWLGFNEPSKHSCKDWCWKGYLNSLLWPSTGNPTVLIFHITGGLTWLSVFLWEEPHDGTDDFSFLDSRRLKPSKGHRDVKWRHRGSVWLSRSLLRWKQWDGLFWTHFVSY